MRGDRHETCAQLLRGRACRVRRARAGRCQMPIRCRSLTNASLVTSRCKALRSTIRRIATASALLIAARSTLEARENAALYVFDGRVSNLARRGDRPGNALKFRALCPSISTATLMSSLVIAGLTNQRGFPRCDCRCWATVTVSRISPLTSCRHERSQMNADDTSRRER